VCVDRLAYCYDRLLYGFYCLVWCVGLLCVGVCLLLRLLVLLLTLQPLLQIDRHGIPALVVALARVLLYYSVLLRHLLFYADRFAIEAAE
jgi:hypothetical protein